MSILDNIKTNYKSLGFAEWIDNKGLQIDTSTLSGMPGIYVMIDENDNIQKVGKSSAGLKKRLAGYKGFDRKLQKALDDNANGKKTKIDASDVRQRKAIKENNLRGMFVYYVEAEEFITEVFGTEVPYCSFDAHKLEDAVRNIALAEGHPLAFGSM